MLAVIRRKLATLVRVHDFVQANPLTDAEYVTEGTRLNLLLSRAEALAKQELAGREREKAIVGHRNQVRYRLHREELLELVRIAYLASLERPALTSEFRRPNSSAPLHMFIASTRRMLDAGMRERELLLQYGLSHKCLPAIAAAVAEFDQMTELVNEAQRLHLVAHRALAEVVVEGMEVVRALNGMVRAQFHQSVDLMAAWERASLDLPLDVPTDSHGEATVLTPGILPTTTPPTKGTAAA